MATLHELLGGQNLTGLIQRIPSGVPPMFPAGFLTPTRRNPGPTFTYWIEEGEKRMSKVIHYNAPPKPASKGSLIQKSATLLHTSEYHTYGPEMYEMLTQPPGSPGRDFMEGEIARQSRRLKVRNVNLRYAAVQMALAKGAVYFDSNGDLLPDSSGAVFSIDYGIPAGHQGGLDVFGGGNLIAASWATASTDIPEHISAIQDAALKKSSLPIEYALYGKNVFKYLYSNDFVKLILNADSGLANSFRGRQIPAGFLGIPQWQPVRSAHYVDKDGAVQSIVGDDQILFLPAPSPEWWDLVEGSYIVPRDLSQITADAQGQLPNIETVYGMYGYAKMTDEPISIKHIVGDNFLPMILNNLAYFIADTTP